MASETTAIRKKDILVPAKRKRAAQADDVPTAEEAKLIRRGEAQLKRGQSKSWRDVKNALAR